MKKENILIRYLRTASILVFISILYASVLSGQTNDSKEQFLPSKQKISDNPLLRLPADKKNGSRSLHRNLENGLEKYLPARLVLLSNMIF